MAKRNENAKRLEYEVGSDNVFADLGFDHPEEALLKARIVHVINKAVDQLGLSQKEVAKIIGVDQSKVSALSRGQLKGFSLARLVRFLLLLGKDVEIRIGDSKKGRKGEATLTFEEV